MNFFLNGQSVSPKCKACSMMKILDVETQPLPFMCCNAKRDKDVVEQAKNTAIQSNLKLLFSLPMQMGLMISLKISSNFYIRFSS